MATVILQHSLNSLKQAFRQLKYLNLLTTQIYVFIVHIKLIVSKF